MKLMYLILFGKSMLMLSSIAEYDDTQMSKMLISNYGEVPQMLECLWMSLVILVGASFLFYILLKEQGNT